ncbi:hypothetical protein ACQP1W_24060 [Spirillospora sp. CA-255316]
MRAIVLDELAVRIAEPQEQVNHLPDTLTQGMPVVLTLPHGEAPAGCDTR